MRQRERGRDRGREGEGIIPTVEKITPGGLDVGPRLLLLQHPNLRSPKHQLSVLRATYIGRDMKQNKRWKAELWFYMRGPD